MSETPAEITQNIINVIGGILIAITSSALTWYFGRPKQQAEIKSDEAEASHSIAAAADVTTNAAMRAVKMLEERFDAEKEETQIKIIRLQNDVKRWEEAYSELNAKWEKAYNELKLEFEKLQKEYDKVRNAKGGMLG